MFNKITRRAFAFALVFALLLSLAACGGESYADAPKDNGTAETLGAELARCAVDVTSSMIAVANEVDVLRAMTSDAQILDMANSYNRLGETPRRAVVLNFSNTALNGLIDGAVSDEITLSSSSRQILRRRILGSFASMINAQLGQAAVAASSLLAWGDSYQKPAGFDGCYLIVLLYDDDTQEARLSFVTAVESKDNTIGVNGNFVEDYSGSLAAVFNEDAEYIVSGLHSALADVIKLPESGITCEIIEGANIAP